MFTQYSPFVDKRENSYRAPVLRREKFERRRQKPLRAELIFDLKTGKLKSFKLCSGCCQRDLRRRRLIESKRLRCDSLGGQFITGSQRRMHLITRRMLQMKERERERERRQITYAVWYRRAGCELWFVCAQCRLNRGINYAQSITSLLWR